MSAAAHLRPAAAILGEIRARLEALRLPGDPETPAFERVEMFDVEDLVAAFRYLLITEQRVCVIVPVDQRFETEIRGLKLVVTRDLLVGLMISDRVLGDRKGSLWGVPDAGVATPGSAALVELALPALTGWLLPNPNGVVCRPNSVSLYTVEDAQRELPSRVAMTVELACHGGRLEAAAGPGPVW